MLITASYFKSKLTIFFKVACRALFGGGPALLVVSGSPLSIKLPILEYIRCCEKSQASGGGTPESG